MKLSLRSMLSLSYLAVILVGMGIIAPLAWLTVESLYVNTQGNNLLAQAQLVAAALGSGSLPTANSPGVYSQTTNTLPGIHSRVIDAQGGAVIDLPAGAPSGDTAGLVLPSLAQNDAGSLTVQELMNRPEIVQAAAGHPGTAVRRLAAVGGKRVLYAAAPVLNSDGSVAQIVYLATPLPDTQWTALPAELRWQLSGVILAAVLLAAAAGLLLARRIAQPLSRLATAAQAVSGGDLSQAVPVQQTVIELNELGQAFNIMTASLRQADQAKTAFISDVSHELRTPLTVIKGTVETLQDGALDDLEGRDSLLESMSRETERLIRLVNDLLVLTRADAGALNLKRGALNMLTLAESRCAHFTRLARKKKVDLVVTGSSEEGGVYKFTANADTDRMAQVLDNLLDNAIRYSPPGAKVEVILGHASGWVTCQVRDAGPGIPAEHLPFIFDRFYKVDRARARTTEVVKHDFTHEKEGGSGLGLSIVRSLVQAHGGQVTASSLAGKGTTITFKLPEGDNDGEAGA